jgi:uncharacterized repeat protein (TIGR02543 family)
MKAILSLSKHSYLKMISVFLIAVILVAGVVGCEGEGEPQVDLTIDSTAGGLVSDPGEGTFTYDEGEDVGLVAIPDCGYEFDNWTGDTTDIADVNAAATNITMNADYSITANFKPIPPNHYKFYDVEHEGEPVPIGVEVVLEDQFGTFEATVLEAEFFGNPVEKEHDGVTPIYDPNRHYTYYKLDYLWEEDSMRWSVEVSNQFNDAAEPQTLTVDGPIALAVPTQKEGHEMVECINHYLVYKVVEEPEFVMAEGVNLKDQFIPDGEDVTVLWPYYFANPVKKTVVGGTVVSEIEDDDLHWVLYDIWDVEAPSIEKRGLQIDNQFGPQTLDLTYRELLAVPSQKNVPPTPPLDHFKCYQVLPGPPVVVEDVLVWDQFHEDYVYTWVMDPMMFCNPVDKVHGTVTTSSNPDNHLMVYWLHGETVKGEWTVTVDNQFNGPAAPQTLLVWGPVALAVPTQKMMPGDHGMPKYLDHYLLYEVLEGSNVTATVDLDDQFSGTAPGVEVTEPVYFANPAVKGYVDHVGMWDPEEHLMFYKISDNDEFYGDDVYIRNQFFPLEPISHFLAPENQLLAVPSVKVEWAPYEPA